jgi:hypothetical protein
VAWPPQRVRGVSLSQQRNSRLSSRRQTIASSAQLWFGDKARGAVGGSNGAALAKRLWVAAAFAGSMPASRIAVPIAVEAQSGMIAGRAA